MLYRYSCFICTIDRIFSSARLLAIKDAATLKVCMALALVIFSVLNAYRLRSTKTDITKTVSPISPSRTQLSDLNENSQIWS